MAAFFFFALRPYLKNWTYLFFVWAAFIGYAQIYVGVHYPGDVLGGTLVGIFIGWILSLVFRRYFNFGKRV
jgi:undecaprenyl-diphosphatase